MKAVVMAGGEGTRLRPLTSNQPKPMVPIVGKPCMEHILELLRAHGFEDVVVTVAFLPQAIRVVLRRRREPRAEHRVLGRGEPARHRRLGAPREPTALDDTFLVISGDALCDFDLSKIVEFHREKGAAVTIGLKSVENPLEFGIVVTDEDGRVERFLEKPSWGQVFSDTINTGIYVIEPEVLRHVPTDRPFDFSKELFPLLLEMGRPLYGFVCDGYWQDIGNLDQYRQANFDALDEKVKLHDPRAEDPRRRLDRRGRRDRRRRGRRRAGVHRQLLPPSRPTPSVGPYSVLNAGVTLRERAPRLALGDRRVLATSAAARVVEGAILGRGCDVRPHARVHEGVAIGD